MTNLLFMVILIECKRKFHFLTLVSSTYCIKTFPTIFRLILAMDPKYGEISRAMRNRGVEIYVAPEVSLLSIIAHLF